MLPVTTEDKNRLENSHAVALYYDDVCYAIIRQPEIYYQRKEERVARQFGTTNKNHPYINVSQSKKKCLRLFNKFLMQLIFVFKSVRT